VYSPQERRDLQELRKYSEMSCLMQSFNIDRINKEQEPKKNKNLNLIGEFKEKKKVS